MDIMEIGMLILAFAILVIYYWKAQYGKRAIPWLLFSIPMLYFSINMVTECVTADEYQYMTAFIDIENIGNHTDPMKVVYEYRISQMVFGTIFKLIPYSVKGLLELNELVRIYKIIHWFFFFGIVLLISHIWRDKILEKDIDNIKFQIMDNVILYSLLALPVSCLMLKVANYDASNVYFAVLGFSMMAAADKKHSRKYAYLGTIAAVFGCMDKWVGCIYWCICVVFFIYLELRENNSFGFRQFYNAIKYCFIATIIAVGISWLNLVYLDFLSGGLCVKINIGNVLFPFTNTLRAVTGGGNVIDYADGSAYNSGSIGYLAAVMGIILIFTFVCVAYDRINAKYDGILSKLLAYLNAFLLCLCIVGGVIGAYSISQFWAPIREIEEGYYNSTDSFGSIIYHFGATNAVEHFVYKLFYAYATILCNYPTVILLLFILGIYISVKRVYILKNDFIQIIMFISLIQPILFSIAGEPAGERYYGVTILLQVVICCYYIYIGKIEISAKIYQRIFGVVCLLYVAEMLLFVPNIKIFSPVWVVHSKEYKESIRKGEWYAGEAMTWGEDISIAGNMIKNIVDKQGIEDYGSISIYGNYGYIWLNNPGFNIGAIGKGWGGQNYKWDDTEYLVLSKFTLFRDDVPEFIYEVEPIATIKYNGEISTWIYKGSQLEKYKEYFN